MVQSFPRIILWSVERTRRRDASQPTWAIIPKYFFLTAPNSFHWKSCLFQSNIFIEISCRYYNNLLNHFWGNGQKHQRVLLYFHPQNFCKQRATTRIEMEDSINWKPQNIKWRLVWWKGSGSDDEFFTCRCCHESTWTCSSSLFERQVVCKKISVSLQNECQETSSDESLKYFFLYSI